jgi:hypothetical protein
VAKRGGNSNTNNVEDSLMIETAIQEASSKHYVSRAGFVVDQSASSATIVTSVFIHYFSHSDMFKRQAELIVGEVTGDSKRLQRRSSGRYRDIC